VGWRDVPETPDFISPPPCRSATAAPSCNLLTDEQIPLSPSMCGRGITLAAKSLQRRECDDPPQFAANVVAYGESASMLRVITERQGDRYQLDLHGTLGGEWVSVLEQHWRSIMEDVPSAKLTLLLSNVDFIDRDGERLLHRMADDDVEFVAAGCMNRYVIDSLKPRVPAAEGGRR
jgi:hypothetical protein